MTSNCTYWHTLLLLIFFLSHKTQHICSFVKSIFMIQNSSKKLAMWCNYLFKNTYQICLSLWSRKIMKFCNFEYNYSWTPCNKMYDWFMVMTNTSREITKTSISFTMLLNVKHSKCKAFWRKARQKKDLIKSD